MKTFVARFLLAIAVAAPMAQAAPTVTLGVSSASSATTTPNGLSSFDRLSYNGRYLLFGTGATDVVADITDTNGGNDIYQKDLQTGITTLVSHNSGSTTTAANAAFNLQPYQSDDGRYVIFVSSATDLVAGKGGTQNAYFWDRTTGNHTYLCGDPGSGTQIVQGVAISGDGNWFVVCFQGNMPKNVYDSSQGTYTGPPTNTGYNDAYLVNRVSGAVTLITHASGSATTTLSIQVQQPMFISQDGSYVALEVIAGTTTVPITGWDTVTGTYLGAQAVYVWARTADTFQLATKRNDGSASPNTVSNPTLQAFSADGRYVYFTHADIDFGTATTDNNTFTDTYRWDRLGGSAKLARIFPDVYNVTPSGGSGFTSAALTISPSGRYLAFTSAVTSWVSGDTNSRVDAFRFDTTTNTANLVSMTSGGAFLTAGANGNGLPLLPQAADTGNVFWTSSATNVISGATDSNAAIDIFLTTFNTSPTITTITNQSVASGVATGALSFTINDAETAAGSLIMTGSSSNTTLVPNSNIVFSGSSNSRTVTVTPAAGQTGTTTVTLTVTDGGGATASSSFGLTVSASAPTVTNVTSSAADGAYKATQSVSIQVTFSASVTVTGAPTLTLNSGGTATYASGSPGTSLTFNYTVGATQNSADLDYSATTSLALAGGTINATSDSTPATLTLPVPAAAGSLGFNKAIVIDTTAPTILSINRQTPSAQITSSATVTVRVTYSESVVGVTTNSFAVIPANGSNIGGTVTGVSGTGNTRDVTVHIDSGTGDFRLRGVN